MEKPPFSFTRHLLLPDILLVALVATDPPTVVRVLGFGLLIHAFVTTPGSTTGDPSNDYSLGFLLGMQVFTALRFLWLERPLDVLRHERDTQSPREMAIWRRIYWAFCLDHSVRAVGWTHQVKHMPPRPRTRPAAFVRRCLVHALFNYLIADAAHTYARTIAPIHSQGSILRASVGASWIPVIYASVNVQYFVLAALSVTFHVGRPEDWPDVFGRWADAYTLRKFWGQVWHQYLRRLVTPVGQRIAQACGFAPGTPLSSYTQLYTGFFLSGAIHCVGYAMVHGRWSAAGSSMPFFLLQAVAITVEDAVLALGRKVGIETSRWTRAVGYAWVLAFGSYTFCIYRDQAIDGGWGAPAELPISPSTWGLQMLGVGKESVSS